jgi:hypothetical protein
VGVLIDFVPGYEASAATGSATPAERRPRSSTCSTRRSTRPSRIPPCRPGFAETGGTALPGSPADFGSSSRDAGAYDELLVRVSAAVRPADIFEEIWVRDIVDLVWEAFRLRRLKACVMTAGARFALSQTLGPLVGWPQADGLARSWAAREPGAVAEIEAHLATAGIGLEGVAARGLCHELGFVERIDRLIMAAEARRNAALREIDRHRATLGRQLRQAVLEAEAQEVAIAAQDAAA